ncbi:MAG: Hsp20/alpha crystallin family protein [Candidatus Zixiibacteriota bacterium]
MTSLMVRPFNGWTREVDRMFNDFFNVPAFRHDVDADFAPRVNIKETKDDIRLTFELPGLDKKDIKVVVTDGNLVVSGERNFREEQKDENSIRTEIRSGKFCRTFTLPDTVKSDSVSADYKNGMLEVKLAKLEEVKPKEVEIKVS